MWIQLKTCVDPVISPVGVGLEKKETDKDGSDAELIGDAGSDDEDSEAFVNSRSSPSTGESLLMFAVKGGSLLVTEELMAHGADVHCTNRVRRSLN